MLHIVTKKKVQKTFSDIVSGSFQQRKLPKLGKAIESHCSIQLNREKLSYFLKFVRKLFNLNDLTGEIYLENQFINFVSFKAIEFHLSHLAKICLEKFRKN